MEHLQADRGGLQPEARRASIAFLISAFASASGNADPEVGLLSRSAIAFPCHSGETNDCESAARSR